MGRVSAIFSWTDSKIHPPRIKYNRRCTRAECSAMARERSGRHANMQIPVLKAPHGLLPFVALFISLVSSSILFSLSIFSAPSFTRFPSTLLLFNIETLLLLLLRAFLPTANHRHGFNEESKVARGWPTRHLKETRRHPEQSRPRNSRDDK